MRNYLAAAATLTLAASCSSAAPPPPDKPPAITAAAAVTKPSGPASASAKASPPALRLPLNVVPTKASATLTIVPSDDELRGVIDLDVTVKEPTRIVWLNATEITIEEARLEQNGATLKPQVSLGGDDFVGLTFEQQLPRGAARIHITYRGKISRTDDRGVFSQQEGGATYLYTQFENIEARRAFPCFDEPAFKIPWQLTIRVKPGDTPLSNTPVTSETTEGGFKVVRFAETKPMPSYLVAFAVGPFDIVDAGKAGKKGTQVRVVAPKGQGAETAYAVSSTPQLLGLIEDYFNIPYPYEKLDVVAIPRLASFGAMENVGLITIASRISLAPAAKETPAFKRGYADIMAHEIAHQWFGDLVTMTWWDDVWLNEAFATWMGNKIVERAHADWQFDIHRIRSASWAMLEDSLLSARKIRQEVETKGDIQNAFDSITYVKGATVIEMFEGLVGDEPFRKGIQTYLNKRAMGNATSSDFLADLSEGAGKDVRAAFATFLDRPGVPLVRAALTCEKGKGGASLSLTQERYLPLGSKGEVAAPPWQIPVCARYGDGKSSGRACSVLAEKTGALALPGATCPSWVMLKEGGAGYYRAVYSGPELDRLLDKRAANLTLAERVSVLDDARALVHNGKLPVGDALARLPGLMKDADPEIARSALGIVGSVPEAFVPEALRPKFSRFISSTFGAKARALGWRAKPSDSTEDRLLRSDMVSFVAVYGEDKALLEEASKLALKWLDDPSSLEDDAIEGVLQAAAWGGDRRLFDRMRAGAKKAKDGRTRRHLVEGMSSFGDPALVREALALVLTDELDVLDSLRLLYQDPRSEGVVRAFLKENIDALLKKVPGELQSDVVETVAWVCDEGGRAEVEALFKERTASIVGGPRRAAQVLEGISLCIAQSNALRPSLTAFLGGRAPGQ